MKRALLTGLTLIASGCSLLVSFNEAGQPCDQGRCLPGYTCVNNVCVDGGAGGGGGSGGGGSLGGGLGGGGGGGGGTAGCVPACSGTDVCVGSSCLPKDCSGSTCADGAVCSGGQCTPIACVFAACGAGSICAGGGCEPNACGTTACAAGQACRNTRCVDVSCLGLTCAGGTRCTLSACVACDASESSCGDGADNDCDGNPDCADSDCSGGACDDGNACTMGETCQGSTCAGGTARTCNTPPTSCYQPNGTCSQAQGGCVYQPLGSATPCNDNNPCTPTSTCDGAGRCSGTPITCSSPPFPVCQDTNGTCNTIDGGCIYPPKANGTVCGTAAQRCCNGACRNTANDVANCGGCGLACATGQNCESVATTLGCSLAPPNTSGRCTCSGTALCPNGQACLGTGLYPNRCSPTAVSQCAPNEVLEALTNCPSYCRYP